MKVVERPYEILIRFRGEGVHFAVTRMLCESKGGELTDLAEKPIEPSNAEEVEKVLGEKGKLLAQVAELTAKVRSAEVELQSKGKALAQVAELTAKVRRLEAELQAKGK